MVKVVKDDWYTTVYITEFELEVRDTKRGEEELTNDIPNVSEDATKDLDENGIIRVGAEVKEGDILIGKITPKGESDPTPEEKLLRAIFGDKAGDVKDASLKAGPSLRGVVIEKKLFSRAIKDRKSKSQDKPILETIDAEYQKDFADLKEKLAEKLMVILGEHKSSGVYNNFKEELIKLIRQLVGQFEEPVTSLILDFLVRLCKIRKGNFLLASFWLFYFGCRGRTRTSGFQVMSLAVYH